MFAAKNRSRLGRLIVDRVRTYRIFAGSMLLVAFYGASPFASSSVTAQHGDPAVTSQGNRSEALRDEMPFRVYAKWAIDAFDANEDGSLTKAEMKDMNGSLVEDRFDIDKNGKLSFDEIVAAIRRPSADKVDAIPASSDNKYLEYAQQLIKYYDEDDDMALGPAEIAVMRRPLSSRLDTSDDGKISLGELYIALKKGPEKPGLYASSSSKRRSSGGGNAMPIVVLKKGFELDPASFIDRFFAASMKKNDKNRDGKLDGKEIKLAKWASPRWQASDANTDGELSTDELKIRYRGMFRQMFLDHETTTKRSQASQQSVRKKRANKKQGGGAPASMVTVFGDGDMLGGLGLMGAKGKSSRESTADARSVDIKLYLFRLPLDSDSTGLNRAVKHIKNSDDTIENDLRQLTKQLGTENYDQVVVSAIENRKTKVVSAASVPQVVGTTRTNKGSSFSTQFVDIGFSFGVTPMFANEQLTLNLDVQKSDLIRYPSEEEMPDERIIEWTYNSNLLIDSGKVVVGTSSSGQHWIMAIEASVKE